MPRLIDYPETARQMTAAGLICHYYNSGAFGFPQGDADVKTVGWICHDDQSIRAEARLHAHRVDPPTPQRLARMAICAWQNLRGDAWLLPMSHWAFELDFGSAEWMPQMLQQLGMDATVLATRATGDAIVFSRDEGKALADTLATLLDRLRNSDFALILPGSCTVALVHHHAQLWWQTKDANAFNALHAAGVGTAAGGEISDPSD